MKLITKMLTTLVLASSILPIGSAWAAEQDEITYTLEMVEPTNSTVTDSVYGSSFADLADHWAKNTVTQLAGKGIISGVTDTSFEPDRNITRAEFAKILVGALNLNVEANAVSSTFTDVKAGEWYTDAVTTAAKAKLIDGYEDGTFRPNASITREELSAMVIRALSFSDIASFVSVESQGTLLAKYNDADQIIWAQKEVAAALNAKIVQGLTEDTLGTSKPATRAEAATMIRRMMAYTAE